MVGIIVFSWGWRENGHSPCNVRLAKATRRIVDAQKETVIIFAQRTVAHILEEFGIECSIAQKNLGYEGSEEVIQQAEKIFRNLRIKKVIPVAQPLFHLTQCISLVQRENFETESFWELAKTIGWIGFDRFSVHPAARNPFRFVLYVIKKSLFGYRPPPEHSEP